jgi:hypothetical protein
MTVPAGFQGFDPVGVGGPVVADVDTGWGALEDVEFFGVAAEVWDYLDLSSERGSGASE